MAGYLFAFLAAAANAVSSVLQRRAGQDEKGRELSLRLIGDLVRKPVWLFGVLAVTTGFVLQAVALKLGQLAAIQPVLIVELPLTILLAWRVLGAPLGRRQAISIVAMTVGLAGLLYFLSPSGGGAGGVPVWKWVIGLAIGYGGVTAMVAWARRTGHDMARGAIYGVAAGSGFGLTAALVKGMTNQLSHGFGAIFVSWQTYLMVLSGAASMYLLQNAMAAGRLAAVQPGLTLADPIVAIVWGTVVFGEHVRGGWFLLLAVFSFAAVVGAVVMLSQAEEVKNAGDSSNGPDRAARDPDRHTRAAPRAAESPR